MKRLSQHPKIPPSPVDWSYLEKVLPDVIWRARWDELAERHGLPYSRRYLQNLDSAGTGPPRVSHFGRVGYYRAELIDWLQTRAGNRD